VAGVSGDRRRRSDAERVLDLTDGILDDALVAEAYRIIGWEEVRKHLLDDEVVKHASQILTMEGIGTTEAEALAFLVLIWALDHLGMKPPAWFMERDG
jgi:hypothetical protein